MADNPLELGRSSGRQRSGELAIGETRTITARDPKTGDVIREYTLIRTARPYVYDLCDAYNASGKGGWIVDQTGNLKLGADA